MLLWLTRCNSEDDTQTGNLSEIDIQEIHSTVHSLKVIDSRNQASAHIQDQLEARICSEIYQSR